MFDWRNPTDPITLFTLHIFINFSTTKKNPFFSFFSCDACLRRWISPLEPTALFSIILKHPTRNQFSKTSRIVALKNKINHYRPTLIFFMLRQSNHFFKGLTEMRIGICVIVDGNQNGIGRDIWGWWIQILISSQSWITCPQRKYGIPERDPFYFLIWPICSHDLTNSLEIFSIKKCNKCKKWHRVLYSYQLSSSPSHQGQDVW